MRTKHLFLALALPAVFAACSNEEFVNDNAAPVKGDLVELGEGFALTGQGISDASTRGVWELTDNKLGWKWLPEILTSATGANSMLGTLNVAADEIGLCWTGELSDGTGSIGSMVYTNYQFLHNGWLATGQSAANFNGCPPYELQNGKIYSDIDASSLTSTSTVDEIKTQLELAANQVSINGTNTKLDFNTGVFTTENKAIFGGSYIVYYPYNNTFADAASLPATSPTSYSDVVFEDAPASAHIAKNTFLVGYAKDLIGGRQASKFSLDPLSAIISLQLRQLDGTAKTISKVALWSEDGFVTNVNLDASKIKASGANAGEALYIGDKKTSSTIVATLGTPAALETAASDAKYKKLYLPILPTTLKGLKVVVYADDNSIAVKELTGEYKFAAAAGKSVKVDLKEDDFKANALIAVDAASLKAAAEGNYTEAEPVTVTVIGDITLDDDVEIKEWATVEGGKIIVPEDKTLTVDENAVVKSIVEVQGQACCGAATAGGKMVVNAGATIAGNVNVLAGAEGKKAGSLEFTHTAGKTSIVAATSTITSDGDIDFKGQTDIRGTLTVNADATAKLSADDSDVNVKGGIVNNDGKFEVEKGKFAMLDANGQTVAAAGENFKNNGTFIDNVGTTIGGATQYMDGTNGDYICKVNEQVRLEEAYNNKTACSTIMFVHSSTANYDLKSAKKHNNKDVDIIDNGTAATTITSTATAAVTIGNLSNTATSSSLAVAKTDKPILVNGDIVLNKVFTTAEDVVGMTANNLTVNKGGSATFANRKDAMAVTLAVAQTIEVKEGGSFTITAAVATKNVARITCTKLIEGGTFTGKPDVIK